MILMTQAELLELVQELRAMAVSHQTAKVRDALNQMADRYGAQIRGRHEAFSKTAVATARGGARDNRHLLAAPDGIGNTDGISA